MLKKTDLQATRGVFIAFGFQMNWAILMNQLVLPGDCYLYTSNQLGHEILWDHLSCINSQLQVQKRKFLLKYTRLLIVSATRGCQTPVTTAI